MIVQKYEFRECTSIECRFRYPNLVEDNQNNNCPLCGSSTYLISQATFSPENQLPTSSQPYNNFEVLLDNIRSTWNVGSMLRTADGAGVTRMYLCGITPTPEHPKTKRTSLGAEQSITWTWHPNSVILGQELINQGKKLWALEAGMASTSLFTSSFHLREKPVVLVIGNEVTGVDPELLDLCEKKLAIPMYGIKRSLNVAVAFGIAVYTLLLLNEKPTQDLP